MTILAGMCAATSVALGAMFMFAAGAPRRYLLINFVALAVGVITASLTRRLPLSTPRFAGVVAIMTGLVLGTTALFGVHIEGASRWVLVAGIALQPSLILLPVALVSFASHRTWLAALGLIIASGALALQPDRAMAGTLAAGVTALWLHRRERPVTVALIVALAGFASTLLHTDAVAPVLFVEHVVQSAFAFHGTIGVAVVVGLLTMLIPVAASLHARAADRGVPMVFGATWLAIIVSALVGNYPTPLVGYGSSAIAGYCLSAALLAR